MEYTVSSTALPVFFVSQSSDEVSAEPYLLESAPITALHYHDKAELGICLSGSGETHIEDKIYRFAKGAIQVLPPLVPHLSKADDGVPCSWIWLSFKPTDLLKNAGLTAPDAVLSLSSPNNFFSGVYAENEFPELTESVHAIAREARRKDGLSSLSVALAVARFIVVSARLKKTAAGSLTLDDGKAESGYSKIAPALEFIGANLDDSEGLSEESLARKCKVSTSTLRRLFTEHTGYSPKAFIVRSRMAYAEYLLRKTTLSVLDVSLYVGYGEVSGFNRTFKAFFGVSPSCYRKKN